MNELLNEVRRLAEHDAIQCCSTQLTRQLRFKQSSNPILTAKARRKGKGRSVKGIQIIVLAIIFRDRCRVQAPDITQIFSFKSVPRTSFSVGLSQFAKLVTSVAGSLEAVAAFDFLKSGGVLFGE